MTDLRQISEVVHRVTDGWGFQGYLVDLPSGAQSGFIFARDEAISKARMEWPLFDDDLSGAVND
jgi:hypothetical protein